MKKTPIALALSLAVIATMGVALVAAQGGDALQFNTSWSFQNLGATTALVNVDFYAIGGSSSPYASDSFSVPQSASFYAPSYPPLGAASFNGGLIASSDQPLASVSNQIVLNNTNGRTGFASYMGATADTVAITMYTPVVMKGYAGLFWTELSVQNTSASASNNVTVYYYDLSGSEVTAARESTSIPKGESHRFAQASNSNLSDGYLGSAKIVSTSGIPVAVIVNEFNGQSQHMYDQFYSYEGFASGGTTLYMPALFINGYGSFNASASVQNLGSAPAHVTWYLYDTGVAGHEVYSYTETIATSTSIYFPFASYANTLINASAVDAGWVGSAKIVSDQPIVGVVNENSGSFLSAAYTGFSAGATDLYFPLALATSYGIDANTSFAIADVSGTSGPVNVTVFYTADKTACSTCNDTSFAYDFTTSDSQYQPTHLAGSSALGTGGIYIGSIKIHVNTGGKTINGIMNENINTVNGDGFTSFDAFK